MPVMTGKTVQRLLEKLLYHVNRDDELAEAFVELNTHVDCDEAPGVDEIEPVNTVRESGLKLSFTDGTKFIVSITRTA